MREERSARSARVPFFPGGRRLPPAALPCTSCAPHPLRYDCVIHFAGYKAVGESVEKPLEYYYNNFQGTITLLRVLREAKCKNVSSRSRRARSAQHS